jgi:hypothetical protein
MAAVKKLKFPDLIKLTIIEGLKSQQIAADVASEPIRTTRLHRFMVTAPKFKKLTPRERQELVWHIIDNTIPKEDQLSISTIRTLTPEELSGDA